MEHPQSSPRRNIFLTQHGTFADSQFPLRDEAKINKESEGDQIIFKY